jgi:hypothetical protein
VADVAVVVLNWNGADDTVACLESLRRSTVDVHSVVVDNGSTDDSLARIRGSKLADIVVPTVENLGYAGGNNVGLTYAIDKGFSFVIVLNNDTVVFPDSIQKLVEGLMGGPARALTPEIRYAEPPHSIWFAGGVVDSGWPRHLQQSELAEDAGQLRPSAWLTGCCIGARRETWQAVGLFNPGYFLIFEDADWSIRAQRQGVELLVARDSVIHHKVSASFAEGPASLLGGFYFVRNGLRFDVRYYPRHVAPFLVRWVARPSLRALVRRTELREMLFRWFGVAAFAARRHGRAPRVVEWAAWRMVR